MDEITKAQHSFDDVCSSSEECVETQISDALSESEFTYDKKFKQLLANKVFLAPILKNIVPEYRDCSLDSIEEMIYPHSNIVVNPRAYDSEDVGKGDETVTHYDVLVDCVLPNGDVICVDFFFDLEMQRENTPGYDIPKRGVYYCCRLISRQIQALKSELYNQLKPVYSVWIIINDIPEDRQYIMYPIRWTQQAEGIA